MSVKAALRARYENLIPRSSLACKTTLTSFASLGLKNSSQHFEKYGYAFIFERNAGAENQNFSRLDNDKFSFDICKGD